MILLHKLQSLYLLILLVFEFNRISVAITPSKRVRYVRFPTKLFEGCPKELRHTRWYHNFPKTCHTQPALAIVAYEGIQDAMSQCREQMRFQQWDCSQPVANHEPNIFNYGYPETAYLWAMSAAGVAWGVAMACAQGWLEECKCANQSPESNVGAIYHREHTRRAFRRSSILEPNADWEWSGCSYGIQYGVTTSRKLLKRTIKPIELASDQMLLRKLENHNLKVGRMIVKKTFISACKCHGVSGSCQQRTCWKKTADLKTIASHLAAKYREARQIVRNEISGSRSSELIYTEESPNRCAQLRYDIQNPQSLRKRSLPRVCNLRNETHSQGDCNTLCCGQGYSVSHEVISYKCDCKFVWCCQLNCKECLQHRWVSTCNI